MISPAVLRAENILPEMPRNKITETAEMPDFSNLPELTSQQMEFVRHILDGKSASDAYRAAYDCSNSVANTIWTNASKLRHDTNVAQWLTAARMANMGAAKLTLEGHLAELERLREIAVNTGNVGAAVQAEQLRGKASGHYVEQIRDVTETDPMETLHRISRLSPDLASKLAQAHGIAWQSETQH